jgi:hypothetical protein
MAFPSSSEDREGAPGEGDPVYRQVNTNDIIYTLECNQKPKFIYVS